MLRSLFEHEVLLYRPQFALHEDFPANAEGEFVAPYSPLDLFVLRTRLSSTVRQLLDSAEA